MVLEFIFQNINNNSNYMREIAILLETFIMDNRLNFPPPEDPRIMCAELTYTDRPNPRVKATHTRGLFRFIVSKKAQQVQITNEHVISKCTDMLMKAVTLQEILGYKALADQVNQVIERRR